jgi:hypothetical protein
MKDGPASGLSFVPYDEIVLDLRLNGALCIYSGLIATQVQC